jgi:uncharacterized protein YdeI (YjbR/CyaY-like superfamily)
MTPASLFFVAFTITMTRIVDLLLLPRPYRSLPGRRATNGQADIAAGIFCGHCGFTNDRNSIMMANRSKRHAMTDKKLNPKVDAYLQRADKWREEFENLRSIALDCDLAEELKWGEPCYQLNGKNVVLMHGFKDYCAYLFFKGALMKDPNGILVQQTENVQSARQIRFTNSGEIAQLRPILKAYILEAIEVEKAGLKVEMKKTAEFALSDEFKTRLDGDAALKQAFEALTPGRQRAYLLHFAQPKQAKTRESRIDKAVPDILAGKGLND